MTPLIFQYVVASRFCQLQVIGRCLLAFLNESVQQHHLTTNDSKQYTGNFPSCQVATHFPKPFIQLSNHRHTERPADLNSLDILSHSPAIVRWPGSAAPPSRSLFARRTSSLSLSAAITILSTGCNRIGFMTATSTPSNGGVFGELKSASMSAKPTSQNGNYFGHFTI